MLKRLNHVAIATENLSGAARLYRDVFGAQVSDPVAQPEHGVSVCFVTLGNTKIELLEPLGSDSPIAGYLKKNPAGGIHHLCLAVDNVRAAREILNARAVRILGDGEAKTGAHGKPVLFLHPKDCAGVLIELEEA